MARGVRNYASYFIAGLFKDDPYLGLAIFIVWIVFFMLAIVAFPPPKKLRQKAQNHIDSYYSEQQV
jgi:hypothetical protein